MNSTVAATRLNSEATLLVVERGGREAKAFGRLWEFSDAKCRDVARLLTDGDEAVADINAALAVRF
jgi:hypothetical protein